MTKRGSGKRAGKAPSTKAGRGLRTRLARARRTQELAAASAETIAHRALRIGRALAAPHGLADPELTRMGHEKLHAGGEAAAAVALRLASGHRLWTDFWFQQGRRGLAVLPRIAASRSPLEMAQICSVSGAMLRSKGDALWLTDAEARHGVRVKPSESQIERALLEAGALDAFGLWDGRELSLFFAETDLGRWTAQ